MSDTGVLVSLDEEGLKSRLILDYTNRDFTGIRSELIRLAHTMMPEWKTVGESSDFGTVLLELYAYMGDIMNYYIDRVASEAFLATAIRPQSVWYIADMLGYKPTAQAAATVMLTITAYEPAPEDPMEPIIIPANTKVYTSSDTSGEAIVFETTNQVTLLPGETGTVLAEEGVTVMDQKIGVSFGVSNIEFVLQQKGIIAGSIRVVSTEGYQSITWLYTTDLATARPTQSVFTTYVDDLNFTHIVFGDNTSGRIPAANAQIFATYRYGVGAQANNIPVKKITTIVPRSGFFEAWQVTVTNLEAPTGGADPESVDSLRHTIPRAGGRIRSRAVTLNDYADLAMQTPGVAKSVAYGTVYTAVKVWIGPTLSSSQDTCSDEMMERLCANVEQTMKDKVLIGSTVVAGPLMCDDLWTPVFIRVNVQVSEVFNRLSVRDQVDSVIRKLLSYAEVDFGTRITLGGVYRAALTVNGVEWAEVTWLSTIRPPDESGGVYIEPTAVPTGAPDAGPVQTLFTSQWQYETGTAGGVEPAATHYRLSDDTASTDPEFFHLAISHRDTTAPSAGSDNRTANLHTLNVGDHLVMSNPANGAWWDYVVRSPGVEEIAGSPTANHHAGTGAPATPGYDEWDVALVRLSDPAPAPAANTPIDFTFIRYSPTPISIGEIADINTDDLHIPRIDPIKYEEEPENYPGHYTDVELIHDGLWITADGGLANT